MSWGQGWAQALSGLGTDIMRFGAQRHDMQRQAMQDALAERQMAIQEQNAKRAQEQLEALLKRQNERDAAEDKNTDFKRMLETAKAIGGPTAVSPEEYGRAQEVGAGPFFQDYSGAIPAKPALPDTGTFGPAAPHMIPIDTDIEKRMALQAMQLEEARRKFDEQQSLRIIAQKALDEYRDRMAGASETRAQASSVTAGAAAKRADAYVAGGGPAGGRGKKSHQQLLKEAEDAANERINQNYPVVAGVRIGIPKPVEELRKEYTNEILNQWGATAAPPAATLPSGVKVTRKR